MRCNWLIPRLRPNGTLPPGMHTATIDELLAAFPARTQQRQIFNDSLRRAVEELRHLDPTLIIYVDGSYVTSKAEPNDIDLLIVTPTYVTQQILDYLDQVCPVEAVSLSIYVELLTPNIMLNFFTTMRSGQAQGIVELT
jgi:hypothetical protein